MEFYKDFHRKFMNIFKIKVIRPTDLVVPTHILKFWKSEKVMKFTF